MGRADARRGARRRARPREGARTRLSGPLRASAGLCGPQRASAGLRSRLRAPLRAVASPRAPWRALARLGVRTPARVRTCVSATKGLPQQQPPLREPQLQRSSGPPTSGEVAALSFPIPSAHATRHSRFGLPSVLRSHPTIQRMYMLSCLSSHKGWRTSRVSALQPSHKTTRAFASRSPILAQSADRPKDNRRNLAREARAEMATESRPRTRPSSASQRLEFRATMDRSVGWPGTASSVVVTTMILTTVLLVFALFV